MGKPFKKTKFGMFLSGASKVVIAGAADFIPGGETLIRLISKTPEDQESTNNTDFGRIIIVVIIAVSVIGVISGKLSSDQLDGILESLGK